MVKVQMIAAACAVMAAAGVGAAVTYAATARGPNSAPVGVFAEESPVKNGLRTQITAEGKVFKAGEPIVIKLEVANVGKEVGHYRGHSRMLNTGLEVRDEAGKAVPFLGGSAQLFSPLMSLEPGQKKEIENFDLGSVYYLRKPGKYTVKLPKELPADEGLPESNVVHFEIKAGGNADGDPAGKLLPLEHEPWILVGNPNGKAGKMKPGASWSEVTGRQFSFEYLSPISIPDICFVYVWLCEEAAAPVTVAEGNGDGTSEYVGKVGRWQVYVGTDGRSRERWPKAVEEIKKALAAD